MNIAIITARGGSKRIPKKNIKDFCGKPILLYSIEAALAAGCFDTVMVSTDDIEIAEIAKKAGAEVPFMRSGETSNDYATTADVLNEVFSNYRKLGKRFDIACCIYPTAPFVTDEKLRNAVEIITNTDAASAMPIVAYSFPPQRAVLIREECIQIQYPEFYNSRSQDLEPIYHDAGQFYAFRVDEFMKSGKLINGKTVPIVLSDLEVQDIDTIRDWKIAEMKYKLMIGEDKHEN